MASLNDKIIEYLVKHPKSKAKEIADALNFSRGDVNHALYNDLIQNNAVQRDEYYRWDLSDAARESRLQAEAKHINNDIEINEDHSKALSLISEGKNVFITGKAGTGKTTLLRKIQNDYQVEKLMITLAPTGIAAENAGGYTMHSFLRLPLIPYLPTYKNQDLYQLDNDTAEVVRNLDMIVIDEISMVRCDMLDAADDILRHYRDSDKPFGGIQLVMFGDLYQLMPVAKDDDWNKIKDCYDTPYFFSSKALSLMEYYLCELNKVYRQQDDDFVRTLNNIRIGEFTLADVNLINSRFIPDSPDKVSRNTVTLMTRNWKANTHNKNMLNALSGKEYCYEASKNNWHEKLPTDYKLRLKPGARVMFIKNDIQFKSYVNGSMGWVVSTTPDSVFVRKDNSDELIKVEKQRWDEFRFVLDKKSKTIRAEITGYFIQIPLKTAWAVTVHKSQGLTFDKVDIDVEDSFTFGQVYVALSRCKTLNGIRLLSRIPTHKIIADNRIMYYLSCINENGRVKPVQPYKVDLDENILKYGVITLSIGSNTYGSILEGSKKRLERNITDDYYAKQIFDSKDGKLLPNTLFSHIKKEWKYNDMNNGNCPFQIRKCKILVLECSFYNNKIICLIEDDIQISTNFDNQYWKVSIPIGKIIKPL